MKSAVLGGLLATAMTASVSADTLGLSFSGTGGQTVIGHALKIYSGPAEMAGFTSGQFAAQQLQSPYNSQFAFATGSHSSGAWDFTFDFSIVNYGPDQIGDDIIIKYAAFTGDSSFLYRHAWRGVYDAGSQSYTFTTAFSSVGQWWDSNHGNYFGGDWSLVWTPDDTGTFTSMQNMVVPGPMGVAAIAGLGLAGRRRRR